MWYQMVGSNARSATAVAGSASTMPAPAKARVKPVPAAPIRKPRRDISAAGAALSRVWANLFMSGEAPHFLGGEFDRLADAHVGHAAAQIAVHHRVDVPIARIGVVLDQCGGLHDLA